MNKRTREIIRFVGHLLETNGTTKSFARDGSDNQIHFLDKNACKFCLMGAVKVVCERMRFDDYLVIMAIKSIVKNDYGLIHEWDKSDYIRRKVIVDILKNA